MFVNFRSKSNHEGVTRIDSNFLSFRYLEVERFRRRVFQKATRSQETTISDMYFSLEVYLQALWSGLSVPKTQKTLFSNIFPL